jgi:hypothetical protein
MSAITKSTIRLCLAATMLELLLMAQAMAKPIIHLIGL